jgi:hypothetical protein
VPRQLGMSANPAVADMRLRPFYGPLIRSADRYFVGVISASLPDRKIPFRTNPNVQPRLAPISIPIAKTISNPVVIPL